MRIKKNLTDKLINWKNDSQLNNIETVWKLKLELKLKLKLERKPYHTRPYQVIQVHHSHIFIQGVDHARICFLQILKLVG